jgi:hypothetical protein
MKQNISAPGGLKSALLVMLGVWAGLSNATDEHVHHATHDHFGNEPIGVMGAHSHTTGDWMFSYRAMRMEMDGNRDGSSRISTGDVFAEGFMIAPTNMTMDMHMFGTMYGVNDDLTVMLMAPYIDMEMDHVTGMGVKFTTETDGIGDVKLSSIFRLKQWGNHQLNLNAGISVPTGSIDEKDDTPMGSNQHLPYPMQLGSGTWDLIPGLTYTGHHSDLSWGAQGVAVVRIDENDNDYTLGDRFHASGWVAKDWIPEFSSSLRVNGQWWGNIDGSDKKLPMLAPTMVPTADPDLRGGRRFDLLVGAAFKPSSGFFKGQRVALEYGQPVYQNLDGPQLETDWTLTLGWQLGL